MTQALTTAQREELKALLAVRRRDLQAQMQQNRENLAPPAADQDGMITRFRLYCAKGRAGGAKDSF